MRHGMRRLIGLRRHRWLQIFLLNIDAAFGARGDAMRPQFAA
jgi:hypothetical protein